MVTSLLQILLPELKNQWVRNGAPIVERLRPGLNEGELDAVEGQLGMRLPRDLRELWAWHDGAALEWACTIGPGSYSFLSADAAVKEYRLNREIHADPPPDDQFPDMYWHASWLPFMVQGPQRLYIDCTRRDRTQNSSPVRLVSWEWEDYDVDVAPSLASAVSLWTWLLASDYYKWNAEEQLWDVRYADIPMFAKTLA